MPQNDFDSHATALNTTLIVKQRPQAHVFAIFRLGLPAVKQFVLKANPNP